MIPVAAYAGRRVGVLGLGRSGLAAARALRAGGAEPICWDDDEAARAGAGDFALANVARHREAGGLAALIVSPGIPHLYPEPHAAVRRARENAIPIDNDVGLFFAALADLASRGAGADAAPPRVVAVTGSNGKSTTTALIHHILREAGRAAQMGGNIGRGVLDLDPPRRGETIVLELSSYQVELARRLAPDVAVFLNLSPDHLDRHGGRGGYYAAKRRLFEIGAPAAAVIGIDEPEGRHLASISDRPTIVSVRAGPQGEGPAVFVDRHGLIERRDGRTRAIDMRGAEGLRGAHNRQNAAAAYAACRAVGIEPRRIEAGLMTFPGLAHRMEKIAEIAGVAYVNDSKATNADAAAKALSSYDRIRWIAGGLPKEGGIRPLAPLFGRVAKAYLIGRAAEDFARALGDAPHEVSGDLASAVAAAAAEAEPGETVLLAPACASFDQFASFEARGEAFRDAVKRLEKTAS